MKNKRKVRKMVKKLAKDTLGLVGVNVGIGVATAVVAGVGGSAVGLATMGGMMPIVGTAVMGKHAIRMVRKMPRQKIDLKYKKPRRY